MFVLSFSTSATVADMLVDGAAGHKVISFMDGNVLSVKTHRRVATGNTKSREVTGALSGTAPSSPARNPSTR